MFEYMPPDEWLPVGATVATQVARWAGRNDIIASVGPKATGSGKGSPAAMFVPALAEAFVNSDVAFGKNVHPSIIGDYTERQTHYEWPTATGAIFHESLHAKHSPRWESMAKQMRRGAFAALKDLEEIRIEAWGLRAFPDNHIFLRASALELALGRITKRDAKSMTKVRGAAKAAAIVLGRVEAGVLSEQDTKVTRDLISRAFDEETLARLMSIANEFSNLRDKQHDRMMELADEWFDVVDEASKAAGEDQSNTIYIMIDAGSIGHDDSADEQPEEDEYDPENDDLDDDDEPNVVFVIRQAMQQDGDGVAIDVETEIGEEQEREEQDKKAAARSDRRTEFTEAESVADEVFEKGSSAGGKPTTVSRWGGLNRSRTSVESTRPPKDDERRAAVKLAAALDRARYRDRIKTKTNTTLPPGRMRSKALMTGEAFKDRGIDRAVEPFRSNRYKVVEDPTLKCGLMTDVSGSMGSAMEPMAVAAWVLAEAIRRVQGGVAASVYYGYSVTPGLKPHEHPKDIKVYGAYDGEHAFNKAFMALDGALNLLGGTGARLLVVCSDGQYSAESEGVYKWLKRCKQAGVAVVWLGFNGPGEDWAEKYCEETGHTHVTVGHAVTDAINAIGLACERALTAAGSRQ